MAKMWAGVTAGRTDRLADDIAHAAMLAAKGIISEADCDALTEGLTGILEDLESGKLLIDESAEDIHMFVEQVLTERIGDTGKKLHTARSRNDQVALDLRMYLRDESDEIAALIRSPLSSAAFFMCSPISPRSIPKPSCRAIRIYSVPSR